MNKKSVQYFATWCLITTSCCTIANDSVSSSFDAAIQRALANRPELGMERSRAEAAKARVDEARGLFLPSLNVFGTDQHVIAYDNFSGVTANAQIGAANYSILVNKITPQYQLNYGAELNYNLYSGGKDIALFKEMSASEQSAYAQYDVVRKQIILDVTELYWGLRKAQITLQIAERTFDYSGEEVNIAKEQFKQGRIAKIDLDTKALSAEKQAVELRKATRSVQDYRRRYAYALGVDTSKEAEMQQFEPVGQPEGINTELFLSSLGLMKEPEVKKVQADLMGAQMRIKQSRSEYMPVIDLFARYTEIGRSDTGFVDAQANLGKDATFVGVKLTWNLFDGFKSDSRVARTVAESEQLRLQSEKVQHDLDNNQQELLAGEADARDQYHLAKRQLELARSQLEIARKRLEIGKLSTLEFHAAQLALDNATSTLDIRRVDIIIQRIKTELN